MVDPLPEEPPTLPASLRFLQILVTVLTVVMIVGIVGILTLIWSRYSNLSAPLPERIDLPSGTVATAFTQGPDWYAVVTETDEILVFDRATGRLRQTLQIDITP